MYLTLSKTDYERQSISQTAVVASLLNNIASLNELTIFIFHSTARRTRDNVANEYTRSATTRLFWRRTTPNNNNYCRRMRKKKKRSRFQYHYNNIRLRDNFEFVVVAGENFFNFLARVKLRAQFDYCSIPQPASASDLNANATRSPERNRLLLLLFSRRTVDTR